MLSEKRKNVFFYLFDKNVIHVFKFFLQGLFKYLNNKKYNFNI